MIGGHGASLSISPELAEAQSKLSELQAQERARREAADRAWAIAAFEQELKALARLPEGENINKPDSLFWVSLVKLASIVKGSGRGHISLREALGKIEQACGYGRAADITQPEIARQWRNALHKSQPRYRAEYANDGGAGFANSALGNTVTFAYPELREPLSRWQLQDLGAKVLGSSFRLEICMRNQVNGSTTVWRNKGGKAYYTGLITCGSIWVCPICANKIATRRAEEIKEGLAGAGLVPVLVTYTLQHNRGDSLKKLLGDLKDALRHTLNGAVRKRFYEEFKVAGYIRSFEIRWSLKTGWHPHAHELLMLEPGSQVDEEAIKSFLMARYGKYLEKRGYLVNEHTVDVRPKGDGERAVTDYLTKVAVELEITGGMGKSGVSLAPFQLLAAHHETGDLLYADLFREYADVTRGRKWLTWSRGLRERLALPEEEEEDGAIAAEEEGEPGDEVVLVLDRPAWRRVCRAGLRGDLLNVAALGVSSFLESWLEDHHVHAGEMDTGP
jgi:hypothetical protein